MSLFKGKKGDNKKHPAGIPLTNEQKFAYSIIGHLPPYSLKEITRIADARSARQENTTAQGIEKKSGIEKKVEAADPVNPANSAKYLPPEEINFAPDDDIEPYLQRLSREKLKESGFDIFPVHYKTNAGDKRELEFACLKTGERGIIYRDDKGEFKQVYNGDGISFKTRVLEEIFTHYLKRQAGKLENEI